MFRTPPALTFLACLAGLIVNSLILGPAVLHHALNGENDFQLFYLGGRLAGDPGMYDIDRVLAAQRDVLGISDPHLMTVRLPFYYWLLSPFARLSYRAAWFLWLSVLVLAITLFVLLYPVVNRKWLALACCWSLPLAVSVVRGQDVALVLLILAIALKLYHGKKPGIAGLVLSLGLIKFHLFVLLALLLLGRREWRLAAGWFAGAVLFLAACFPVAGWRWPQSYTALLLGPEASPGLGNMPNLHGLAGHFSHAAAVEIVLSALAIGLTWVVIRRAPFQIAFSVTMVGSLLLSRHTYMYDCAVLIPAFLSFSPPETPWPLRDYALVLLFPIPYLLALDRGWIAAVLFLLLIAGVCVNLQVSSGRRSVPVDAR